MGGNIEGDVSTSLAVVTFTGLIGAAGYVATGFRGPEDLPSLPPPIFGPMIGAALGVRLRDRPPDRALRGGFGIFMVVVASQLLPETIGVF